MIAIGTLILSIVGGTSLCYALYGTIKAIEEEKKQLPVIGVCYGIAIWCLVTAMQIVKG